MAIIPDNSRPMINIIQEVKFIAHFQKINHPDFNIFQYICTTLFRLQGIR